MARLSALRKLMIRRSPHAGLRLRLQTRARIGGLGSPNSYVHASQLQNDQAPHDLLVFDALKPAQDSSLIRCVESSLGKRATMIS